MPRRCGTICLTQIFNNPPWIKSLPVSSSSHLEDICSIEILFTVLVITCLAWSTNCSLSSSLYLQDTSYVNQDSAANLKSPTSFTGTFYCAFLRSENWTGFIPLKQRVRASLQADLPHSSSEKIMCSIEVTPLHCLGKQHVLHETPGSLLFTALETTCLTWSTWSMVISLESLIFIDPT